MFSILSTIRQAFGSSERNEFSDEEDEVCNEKSDALIEDILSNISLKEQICEIQEVAPPNPVITTQYRKGTITRLNECDGIIDDKYFFDRRDAPNLILDVGKSVSYHAYRQSEEQEWRVNKIITVHEEDWGDSDVDESQEVVEALEEDNVLSVGAANKRTITGTVVFRDNKEVVVRDSVKLLAGGYKIRDTRFSMTQVSSDFVPKKGDALRMEAHVEISEETEDHSGDVITVISITPVRCRKDDLAIVTFWHVKCRRGVINNDIYFDRDACATGYIPRVNDEVVVEAIECDRSNASSDKNLGWRALSVDPLNITQHFDENPKKMREVFYEMDPDLLKDKGNLIVQDNTDYGRIPVDKNYEISVVVSNKGESRVIVRKHYIDTTPSNLVLISPRPQRVEIYPHDSITFVFKLKNNFIGHFKEAFIIEFGNFEIGRVLKWEAYHPEILNVDQAEVRDDKFYLNSRHERAQMLLSYNEMRTTAIPAPMPTRPPSFQNVRMPRNDVPNELKRAMLSPIDIEHMSRDWRAGIRTALREFCPELQTELSSANHCKRFHTLLHILEVDGQIEISKYNKTAVSFQRRGQASEFLALELPELQEGRPSLIIGDKITIKNSFASVKHASFEGCVHRVTKDEAWFKFDARFHSLYNSESYDVFFQYGRGGLVKCHFALDQCHKFQSNLWLFPKGVRSKPHQIDFEESDISEISVNNFFASFNGSPQKSEHSDDPGLICLEEVEKTQINGMTSLLPILKRSNESKDNIQNQGLLSKRKPKLEFLNKRLNHRQKEAVRNILIGEARPLPYIIFGPPGTGKTVTLVETILQLYSLRSDSRLLVATPSNSSANLLAQRLLDSELLQPGDMVRLVAHHIIAEGKVPVELAPYCASLDISSADENVQEVNEIAKMNRKSIMLRRIVIGTCIALGQVMTLGLARGHFTHILVDEAGQASEPEILIPLSFMAHESGQAILAGDPNQLGPVVQSKFATDFGLDKSLLSRLLTRFPYQRDIIGFPDSGGYDPRLVTRLTANYRSLPDILELPSHLFYDGDLDPMVSDEDSYESKLLKRAFSQLGEVFQMKESAIVFRGVIGSQLRDHDSPSYWNPHELFEVVRCVRYLLAADIKCEDIGIITPYQKQVTKVRRQLETLGLASQGNGFIKVGSVEEFQGQEKMVIILSTVRTNGSDHIDSIGPNTVRHLLGFLNNPERLNVAISRARALLIICGDAEILSVDKRWRSVVQYCISRKSYYGPSVPKHLLNNEDDINL